MKPTCFEELSKENFATANHRYSPEGVFIMKGPLVRADCQLDNANITDIAPTILYLSGLKIPKNMDGRVLGEIINPENLQAYPPKYIEEEKIALVKGASKTSSEDEQVKEHLRRLGYLG